MSTASSGCVSVFCASPEAGETPVVQYNAEERRVWVKRGDHMVFSSTFDAVLGSTTPPAEVYATAAEPSVKRAQAGGVGCVICCGALSSGKAALMNALPSWALSENGGEDMDGLASLAIAPRAMCEMQQHAAAQGQELSLSAVQIYFETITDLLQPDLPPALGPVRSRPLS